MKKGKIALNYLYLSPKHAGGKDQVGLNLLRGLYKINVSSEIIIICYEYSKMIIQEIAPEVELLVVRKRKCRGEFGRLFWLEYDNTVTVPTLIKKNSISLLFQLSVDNGWRKMPCKVVLLPHDIKAISHRKLAGLKIPFYKYYLYKILYLRDFKHADKIIAISDGDREEIKNFYPQFADKVYRIYNPIVVKEFECRERIINEPYILAVNLQFLHKNIITLVKAYEKIQSQIEQKLVLVGNLPQRVKFLEEYVIEHQLSDRIIFTGFVTEEEKYRWMINADLYVNPTLFEGFGMTAVEAMILQVPTLLSKIPVNYEVTKGMCEYYEPAEDSKVLSQKIIYIIKHGLNNVEEASNIMRMTYSFERISNEYYQLFNYMLNEDEYIEE